VIVLVPIALGVPAVLVFVPPLMALAPASLARNVQFAALVISLPAAASMVFNSFVQVVFGVSNALLAAVGIFCVKARRYGKKENRCQNAG
jgi:hypothetical protein